MRDPDEDALYGDDPDHPIPFLQQLDAVGALKTGGATLFVAVASPLEADERSQRRLLRKIENYLGFIGSAEYRADFGEPDIANTTIQVGLHDGSHPAIRELLRRCEGWVGENKATLVVEPLPAAS